MVGVAQSFHDGYCSTSVCTARQSTRPPIRRSVDYRAGADSRARVKIPRSILTVLASLMLIGFFSGVLIGCSQLDAPVCAAPYIAYGKSCCLDRDMNKICDVDENSSLVAQQTSGNVNDCSLCIPKFITEKEQVIVYRYVCVNGSVMGSAAACGENIVSSAAQFSLSNTQDLAFIKTFTVTPVCRGEFNAAELHLLYEKQPENITLQLLEDPAGSYKNVASLPVRPELYYYVGFCRDCQQLINLRLDAARTYAVRVMFTYPERKVYSREYLVDPTPQGDVGRKSC